MEIVTTKLGLRVIADPMADLETAAVGVWFDAGAMDERAHEHGVAHLLEHMAFKGTRRRTARRIAEEIEAVGGFLNAATGYQKTGYFARVMGDDVERALDVIADIVMEPALDFDELEREKEVVVQEIGEAADTPDDVVMEALQALAFPDSTLGRPILGTVDSVRGHDGDRLRRFMQSHYSVDRAVVTAAGAIVPQRIATWAENYFDGLATASPRPMRDWPAHRGGWIHDNRKIEQTHIALSFPAASARSEDAFAARIFCEAFGGGMSSRLFQKIREERGLAYSVFSFIDAFDETGAIGVYVGTDADNAPLAVSLVMQELRAVADEIAQAEIDRARALLRSSLLMGRESPANRAEAAAGQLFTHGRVPGVAEIRARLDAVTAEAVRACAQQALSGAPALAVVGPVDAERVQRALG